MNWIYGFWSMMGGACAILAFVHFTIWLRRPAVVVHLLFVIIASSIGVIAAMEVMTMKATSPEQYVMLVRWGGVPVFVLITAVVAFLRAYLGARRMWLAFTVCVLSLLVLVVGLSLDLSYRFTEMPVLRTFEVVGGDTVTLAYGPASRWLGLVVLRSVLYLGFIVDCSISLWRRGDPLERRRAALIGGSIALATVFSVVHSALLEAGLIESPYLITPACLVVLFAMAFELGSDVSRKAEYAKRVMEDETLLRETEGRMALVANSVDMGMWEWDLGRNQMWMSEGGRVQFGIAASEPLDLQVLLGAIDAQDRDAVARAVDEAVKSRSSFRLNFRVTRPDGRRRWIAWESGVSADGVDGGRVLRGVSRDITQAVRDERRFRLVVDDFPNSVFIADKAGRILLANLPAEEVFGYSLEEFKHLGIDDLLPERFRSNHVLLRQKYFERPIRRRIGPELDIFGRRKDGSEFPVEVWTIPIDSEDGDQVLVTITDLTERRRQEREAMEQRNTVAHLSRVAVVGELSSSLAHELNQPLAAILSNAQAALRFLEKGSADLVEVREILGDIVDDDRRAGEVIRRMRAMLAKSEVQYQKLDMNAVTTEVARLVQRDLSIRQVRLSVHCMPDLPAAKGDRVQMQQVLLNLFLNACDAMEHLDSKDRVVDVSIALRDADSIEVRVADQGDGVPPERMAMIFEPFQTTKSNGLGVGLSVCRSILNAHGGAIWAVNNESRGATFCFSVPVFREAGA
ncbi:PAS domain S-box protein [uncultured Piscinibacter sp.]|uniref:PAS domain-containing sensor histidine kinase n=1 Tax=uncultured Piscinibacter sp. TaxID=1131835 RepID=UPI0026156883|nr:PAS domain S-box protein [uncultured Piscinibacter sp.]